MRTLLFCLTAFVTFIPVMVFAQNNLVNLPIGETDSFNDYINAVYLMFVSIAALIAVIKIIIAGVKYMFSDIVTQKSDAKNDIKGALLGLLVVLTAVIVLSIINPDLTTFNPNITAIQERERVDNTGSGEPGGDLQTIEQFCAENNGECTSQSCEYLATNYWATWVVNDPINRLACSALCNGVIVGRDALNEGSCLYVSSEVPVNLPELTETLTLPCLDANGTPNCDQALRVCSEGYDGVATEVATNGVPGIECSPRENSDSPIDIQTDTGNSLLDEYMANDEDVSNVLTIYAINTRLQETNEEITITEDLIDTWADTCELNPDGSDTGNVFIDIRSGQAGGSVWACAN